MNHRRLLLMHAHPDDEASSTGATIAQYAASGAAVTLVTCTRGELGEIVAPELAGLRDGGPEQLAGHREAELAAALSALGPVAHHWLGGAGRWRDSGMPDTPDNDHPRAFARAELGEATRALVELVRAARPQVVVTYDPTGGYGHPDHIQAHRVTMAAVEQAADPAAAPELGAPWRVAKVYWTALPRSAMQRMVDEGLAPSLDDVPAGVPDEQVTATIDARDQLPAKVAALRAHRSQVDLDSGLFAAATAIPEFAVEHYVLARGTRGPGAGPQGREDDLFAGVSEEP